VPATPLSHWIGFHVALLILLGLELAVARRKSNQPPLRTHESAHRTAIIATTLWVAAALAFAVYVMHSLGTTAAVQYLAGYMLEESMSIDNLFIFLLLFGLFQIDHSRQPKVLFWGVAGAIVMRGLFIAGGITLLTHFAWISYLFGAILLIAAVRLLIPSEPAQSTAEPRWITWLKRYHPISTRQDNFVVIEDGRPTATILLLALIAIELTDVVFALDSIPAVLSITRHPFLAYTSNIMAVMGLRSLYFLLIDMLKRIRFLHYGLAAVLGFAAIKMLGSHWFEVGPVASLLVIVALLTVTVCASLWLPVTEKVN
jgi:tellurite resistance protein TerC